MNKAKTYVKLPSGNVEVECLISNIKTARQITWEYKKWFARPVLIEKNGNSRLFVGQSFDSKDFELKEKGWTHDHCDICEERLADYQGAENFGYFNGSGWLCQSCYDKFINDQDIQKIIERLHSTLG